MGGAHCNAKPFGRDYLGMTEPPRRPTLHLKNPPLRVQPAAPPVRWKCKPCGALLEVDLALADDAAVRCPSCNARLGRVEQFRGDPAEVRGVRARLA